MYNWKDTIAELICFLSVGLGSNSISRSFQHSHPAHQPLAFDPGGDRKSVSLFYIG